LRSRLGDVFRIEIVGLAVGAAEQPDDVGGSRHVFEALDAGLDAASVARSHAQGGVGLAQPGQAAALHEVGQIADLGLLAVLQAKELARALVGPQDQAGVVGDDHGLVDQVDQPLVQLVLTQRRDPLSQTFNQRRDTLAVLVDEGVGLPRYRVQHPAGAVVDRQGDGGRRALRVADRPEPVRRLAPLGVGLGHVAHHQDAAAAMSRAADGGAEHARGQRARLIEGLARLGIVQRLHIIVLDGERVRRAIFHVRILREWPQHLARIGVVSMIAGAVRSD